MQSSHLLHILPVSFFLYADVYGAEPRIGRGGWIWYTGSADWWARVAIEAVLGITIENERMLVIAPRIPPEWTGYRVICQLPDNQTICTIEIKNGAGAGRVIKSPQPPFSKGGLYCGE